MKKKQYITCLAATTAMVIIILDGQTALEGAQKGISLCIQTIIPSLFPFLVLSILQTNALSGITLPFLQPLCRLLGIPMGMESIFICGFLGGYPVGAQCISTAYQMELLKKEEAERMLAFCNNAGPAFLFGMVSAAFPDLRFAWLLWGIHILSAFLVAGSIPHRTNHTLKIRNTPVLSLSTALCQALRTIAIICGWVILFRILMSFLQLWILWKLSVEQQTAFTGFLELSNGCCELPTIPSLSLRFIIASCILAFGGVCVFMQTLSVTQGLSARFYIAGKLLQTFYSLLISTAIAFRVPHLFLPLLLPLLIILRKVQKKSSIHDVIGV